MNTTHIVGIDIGLKGGIVVISEDDIIEIHKMPICRENTNPFKKREDRKTIDIKELHNLLIRINDKYNPAIFAWEHIFTIFKVSKGTMRSLGIQLGIMRALVISLNKPYIEVSAKEWQRTMFYNMFPDDLKKDKGYTKEIALKKIEQLIGDKTKLFKNRTSYHDGMIDAFLIARYILDKKDVFLTNK